MEDLKSLVIGVLGGLLVLVIAKAYRAYQRKNIRDDIEFIEFEKGHLEAMKKSSVEMNRSSFRAIFLLFLLVGLANLIPKFLLVVNSSLLGGIADFFSALIWALIVGLCYKFQKRYDNLKNFKSACEKMDLKLEKLNEKLEAS